jgi:hypothetical protein
MKKIGLTLLTLAMTLAACGEVPTAASADDAQAAMNGFLGGSGNYAAAGPGLAGSGHIDEDGEEPEGGNLTIEAASAGPGFLGSGH